MNNPSKKSLKTAFDHFQTAEHLYHTTFPVAKNPKLLLAIVKSISNSLEYVLEAILIKEKLPLAKEPIKNINAIRPLATKYHLSTDDITFMLRIQEILHAQKQSPVEFQRGDRRIICSKDYELEILSPIEGEQFLIQTKKILNILNQP